MMPRFDAGLSTTQRQVLARLIRAKGVRRSELIDELETSPQTIMRVIAALNELGLVAEEPLPANGPGKPAYEVRYNPGALAGLGLAVSKRQISVVLADMNGATLAQSKIDGRFEDIGLIGETVATLLADMQAAVPPGCRLVGLGASLQGYFIEAGRRIVAGGDPAGWATTDLRNWLGGLTGLPLSLSNDARVLAASLIPSSPSRNFFSVWLGSGIGGGLVLGGRLIEGTRGNAGEIGALLRDRGERPSEPNFRAAAGVHDWSAWRGLDAMAPKARARLEDWAELAAVEISLGLNAVVALTDVDRIYIGSRMPRDLMEWFFDQIDWVPPGRRFIRGPQDAILQLPPPTIEIHMPRSFAALAAQVAVQNFLTDGIAEET